MNSFSSKATINSGGKCYSIYRLAALGFNLSQRGKKLRPTAAGFVGNCGGAFLQICGEGEFLRGRVVPLKALNGLLGITAQPAANADDELSVLLVQAGNGILGLLVDGFDNSQDRYLGARSDADGRARILT